jgi:hypothetical protein
MGILAFPLLTTALQAVNPAGESRPNPSFAPGAPSNENSASRRYFHFNNTLSEFKSYAPLMRVSAKPPKLFACASIEVAA